MSDLQTRLAISSAHLAMIVASEGLRSANWAQVRRRARCNVMQLLFISISRSSVISSVKGSRWTAQSRLRHCTASRSAGVEDCVCVCVCVCVDM